MTPEEQFLITRTFDRMSALPAVAKDMDAERLICQQFDRMPDAPYRLVQSVLVQEQALEKLSGRLRQLEDAAAADVRADLAGNNGASFLSPYQVPPPIPPGSVPAVASKEAAAPPDDRTARPPPSPGGGFLASALSTATGVAGGMLLTDGLRELFGGHAASANPERGPARDDDVTTRDGLRDDAQDAQLDAEEATSPACRR